VKFAAQEGTGSKAYVRFANMLITDAQYLLVGNNRGAAELTTGGAESIAWVK